MGRMYDELYEAWIREKRNEKIQPLPKDFYTRVAEYVRRIREEKRMLDERTVKGRAIKKEEENVKKLIKELIHLRLKKIIDGILKGEVIPSLSLTEEETKLYEEISAKIEAYQKTADRIMRGEKTEIKSETISKGFVVVRILKAVPAIIGADMKTYGPFKPEDVATLPRENAKLLIKQGAAVEIEVK